MQLVWLSTFMFNELFEQNVFCLPLQLSVFAFYWLINKTGIPLVFRQEGCSQDAAGKNNIKYNLHSVPLCKLIHIYRKFLTVSG